MFKNMRLGAKLIIVGAVLIAVPLAVVAYLTSTRASAALSAVEQEQYGARARLLAKVVDEVFKEEMKIAQNRAGDALITDAATAVLDKGVAGAQQQIRKVTDNLVAFRSRGDNADLYQAIIVVGLDGVVFAASDPKYVGVSVADRDYIKQALAGKLNGGTAALNKVTGKPFTAVATPILWGDKVVGVYGFVMDIAFLRDLVANEKIGERGFAFVIDKDGMILAHPKPDHVYKKNFSAEEGSAPLLSKMLAGESGILVFKFEGLEATAGYASVPSAGWSVGVTEPLSDSLAEATALTQLIIRISVAALIVAFMIFLLFSLTVTRPLRKSMAFAELVAAGDFTQALPIHQRDEVGKLADALNSMSVRLREMVATIQESAQQVAASSEQISASSTSLAEGAQSQASTLEETSASVEELSASVDQVSGNSQSQAAAVEQGARSMAQVQKSIDDISKSLTEISMLAVRSVENAQEGANAVMEVVQGITLIAESSEKIGGIVEVIADIADQTNLLALNASIEAARAGEHGRGFAVVADEVSKLADRSSSSTKQIESLIRESVKNVTRGVEIANTSQGAMEQIRGASQKVKDMITQVNGSMKQQVTAITELAKALQDVNEMSQSIMAATEEQSANAKQVAKAVESVNELTQTAASSAEEMSSSTEQLSSMAQELQRMTAQFKIGENGQKKETEAEARFVPQVANGKRARDAAVA